MKKVFSTLITCSLLAFVLQLSSLTAKASSYTFQSNDKSGNTSDMMDLEHGYYYGWSLQDSLAAQLGNQLTSGYEITSATLVYKNIYNWVHETNDQLSTFLLQSAPPMPGAETVPVVIDGVTQGHNLYTYTKTTSSQVRYTTKLADPLPANLTFVKKSGNYYYYTKTTTTTKVSTSLTPPAIGYSLTSTKFVPDMVTLKSGIKVSDNLWERADQQSLADINWGVDSTRIWDGTEINPNPNPWHDPLGGSARGFDLTYSFDQELINVLTEYALDGSIGFGIDPDCHYYNSGVYFYVETQKAEAHGEEVVPEPSTIVLFGTGLMGVGLWVRRRRP